MYAAPNSFEDIMDFLGSLIIVISGPRSKFSTVGGLSVPSLTVRLLLSGRVAKLLTAVTKALRFKRVSESLPLESGSHNCNKSISSSDVNLHAEETNTCFFAYSSISCAILQGHFIVDSSPRPTVTTESLRRQACASG